ncbi:MAG: DUF456 domain-containing protein [Actinobacteria bacterium]|nr:DUF456 domain-containing protein [Actinomycetota bacterium]
MIPLVVVVMTVGLFGTVVPLLPGLPLIWVAALAYGLVEGFTLAGVIAMTAITVLLVGGTAAKYVLAGRGASTESAPKSTLAAGALLGFVGFFVVPVIGFLLGALLGVLLAERRRLSEWPGALNSTRRVVIGFGQGVLLEIGAGVVMIVCWAGWVSTA